MPEARAEDMEQEGDEGSDYDMVCGGKKIGKGTFKDMACPAR